MPESCPSADSACRRACRSPRLASVISFSSSGLTALALASVVLMRSWSMTSLARLRSSDLRCEALRESLCLVFWWRIARRRLRGAQLQATRPQRLDDLVDRLLAEVRDRRQLALGLADQLADGLDPRPLEAVVGAHAELELLDQDVIVDAATGRRRGGGAARTGGRRLELAARPRAQRRDLSVGEDRQMRHQDLGRRPQRRLGLERAVGLDVQRELVVVGALP